MFSLAFAQESSMNINFPIQIRKLHPFLILIGLVVLFNFGMDNSLVVRAEAEDPTVTLEPVRNHFNSTKITINLPGSKTVNFMIDLYDMDRNMCCLRIESRAEGI
jgi:hypothetical protein